MINCSCANQIFYDSFIDVIKIIEILVAFMSRLSNLVIVTMLSSSIYMTFSVKNDVAGLAKKVALVKNDIRHEQEKIAIYKAEWAVLTEASHIDKLQKKLIPNLKVVSVAQIQTINTYQPQSQFAHNNISNQAFNVR